MCPYSELFWSVLPRIRTEYREVQSISPYSVRMQGNTDQNNSEYGQFQRSATCYVPNFKINIFLQKKEQQTIIILLETKFIKRK